jgi:hypothetical protein
LLVGLVFLSWVAGAHPSASAPSVTADLDGDGHVETIAAAPSPDGVRLEVRDASGGAMAEAVAAAPPSGSAAVTLDSAPIGSAGTLVEVTAGTGASECRTVWRYRDRRLARLPLREAGGHELPDCGNAEGWTYRWQSAGTGRPSFLIREIVQSTAAGPFHRKEAFVFAGFSLDYAPMLSSSEINGIPIPAWYPAVLYTRSALETLYGRFGLSAMKSEPTLRFEADRSRGIFQLRFTGPAGEISGPVEAYGAEAGAATLAARIGAETAHVSVSLSGEKHDIPIEAHVEGLGSHLDQLYAPAGSWRGGSRQVFASAADEIASEDLVGSWNDPRGKAVAISLEGAPPYHVRIGAETFSIDLDGARPPADLMLRPTRAGSPIWGITLRGPNAMEKTPYRCENAAPDRGCAPAGAGETLRRIGARINVS